MVVHARDPSRVRTSSVGYSCILINIIVFLTICNPFFFTELASKNESVKFTDSIIFT